MWYRFAQFGGGAFLGKRKQTPQQQQNNIAVDQDGDTEAYKQEAKDQTNPEKEKYDKEIYRNESIGSDGNVVTDNKPDGMAPNNEGPATLSTEARRKSPYHPNPEETPLQEQLEAVRQENVNHAQSSVRKNRITAQEVDDEGEEETLEEALQKALKKTQDPNYIPQSKSSAELGNGTMVYRGPQWGLGYAQGNDAWHPMWQQGDVASYQPDR